MTAEQRNANKQYYLSRGRCPRCGGKNPLLEGYMMCAECQKKRNDYAVKRRDKWKSEGRCSRCGGEIIQKGTLCQRCKEYMASIRNNNAKRCKNRRDWLRTEGKCTRCGIRYADWGHSWCRKCLDAHKAYTVTETQRAKKHERQELRRAEGRCIDCGKPIDGESKARCSKCLEGRRDSNRKYRILKRIDKEAEEARRRSCS